MIGQELVLRDLLPDPLGEHRRIIDVRVRQDRHELLATVTPELVDLTRRAPQDLRHLLEYAIAHLVAARAWVRDPR